MELNIKEKKENPLLHRTEIKVSLVYTGKTPLKEEVKKLAAGKLGSDPELTIIKKIKTMFGASGADVLVYVYNDKEKLKRIEPKETVKKEKPAEEKEDKPEKEKVKETKGKDKPEQKETPKEESKETEKK